MDMSYKCFLIDMRRTLLKSRSSKRAVRTVLKPESDYYTDMFGVTIEIDKTDRKTDFNALLKPDKLVIQIPRWMKPNGPGEEENTAKLETFIRRLVAQYGHKLERTIPIINSVSQLKARVAYWAKRMDIPMPDVTVKPATGIWGRFRTNTDTGSGDIVLHEFLRYVPIDLADNTIVHELTHAKQYWLIWNKFPDSRQQATQVWGDIGHSSEFWQLFSSYLPDYADRKRQLEDTYSGLYGTSPLPTEA